MEFFFFNTKSIYEEVQKIDLNQIINYIENINWKNYLTINEGILLCQLFIMFYMFICISSDKKFLNLYDTDIKNIFKKIEFENLKIKEISNCINEFDKKIKTIKRNITTIKKDLESFEESIENYEFNMDVFEKKINKLYKYIEVQKENNILIDSDTGLPMTKSKLNKLVNKTNVKPIINLINKENHNEYNSENDITNEDYIDDR